MATALTSLGTWVNEKNAIAAYNGLHRNRVWESWIISDRTDQKAMSNPLFDVIKVYNIFTMFSRIENTLSPEKVTNNGYFPDPRGPYFYVALFLVVVNSIKSRLDWTEEENRSEQNPNTAPLKQPEPTVMNQVLVFVSQATPYLMIITNIAVNIIQIQRDEFSAWIELAFTGITLINITPLKPEDYISYVDTVLGYPVAAAALYYGNNRLRFKIVSFLTLDYVLSRPTVKKKIDEINKKIEAEKNKKNQIQPLIDRIYNVIEKEITLIAFHTINRLRILWSRGYTSR